MPRRRLRRTRAFGEAMRPCWVESGHPLPKTPRQKWIETKESWERSRHIEVPAPLPAAPPRPGGLRVAFLIYRGNPRCGGQGVYTRHLTRELVALGHSVEVFSGPPWPELDAGRRLHARARARPLPRPRPLPGPAPARVPLAGGLDRVRRHVHGRLRRAAGLLAAGPASCWRSAATTSTSSTTTSASATGCSAWSRTAGRC